MCECLHVCARGKMCVWQTSMLSPLAPNTERLRRAIFHLLCIITASALLMALITVIKNSYLFGGVRGRGGGGREAWASLSRQKTFWSPALIFQKKSCCSAPSSLSLELSLLGAHKHANTEEKTFNFFFFGLRMEMYVMLINRVAARCAHTHRGNCQ